MVVRNLVLGLTICVALAGMFAWNPNAQARPPGVQRNIDPPKLVLPGRKTAVNAAAGATCESTGFEAVEGACGWDTGFMCGGGFVGVCNSPASGVCTGDNSIDQNCCVDNPNPLNGWYTSIASLHCNEPHIDTANPATGTQHLRFEADPLAGNPPGCTGFTNACRITAFTPNTGPLPCSRTVIDFDIAMGDPGPGLPPFGSSGQYFTVSDDGPSGVGILVGFDEQAVVFVYDNAIGGYAGIGFLTGNGAYDHITIDMDPNNNLVEYRLSDASGAVTGGYVHDFTGLNNTVQRAIMINDNAGFFWDVDNYSVVRGVSGCHLCFDNIVQSYLGEECDGNNDEACPGRCRLPDDPDGGCTCIRDCGFCSNDPDCVATNGVNGPFLTHGGFFTFVADGPFVGIDTCGSDFDTTLFVGVDDFCGTGPYVVNDECADVEGDCSDGSHGPENCMPFASCYDNNPNNESCLCFETTAGSTLSIWAAAYPGATPPAGSNLLLTITKALSCGPGSASIPNGACCNGIDGVCTDNVLAADCAGPSDTYSDNKLCSMISCSRDVGSCCDSSPGLAGRCTPGVFPEDCTGALQTFSKLDDCTGGVCEEITGACCDGLTGGCSEETQGGCPLLGTNAPWSTWTIGAACSEISCTAAAGACCDTGTNDPTVATCTQTIMSACDCSKCSWAKGVLCEETQCLPNFQIIPTVSQWGLGVLTLLLLVGGKIYFGRRKAGLV